MNNPGTWEKYKECVSFQPELKLMLDYSRINFSKTYLTKLEQEIKRAFQRMLELEQGQVMNIDEKRQVGHYWLRNPELAPTEKISEEISKAIADIEVFSEKIHQGKILSSTGDKFKKLLLIGVGGSALGPQLLADALIKDTNLMDIFFLDNTDPDEIERVLSLLQKDLKETIVLIISKSGRTTETHNCMLETKKIYEEMSLPFFKHAVAITQPGSYLAEMALKEQWLAYFPLWEWVGGRTSLTSPVGLLPAALQGIDIQRLLEGARLCDQITRREDVHLNPAALMALMWYQAVQIEGREAMVILPYKERLRLLGRYLQQLIMESLGKEKDLKDRVVHQGMIVFGNKGTTDQHSFLQQLLDGPDNFFVSFIEVLKDRDNSDFFVEEDVTTGDYLSAFLQGTKEALTKKGRKSLTVTIEEVSPFSLGVLIALFERAVGFYADLININPYHQPAVEEGKKGARYFIKLQKEVLGRLKSCTGQALTVEKIAQDLNALEDAETIFKILEHASFNHHHFIDKKIGPSPFEHQYFYLKSD